jgi:hypothetical protein
VKGESMNLIENVYKIAENFMDDAEWVNIDYNKIDEIAKIMISEPPPEFPIPIVEDTLKGIVLELVAASINYCYWYGKSTIRPNGVSSTMMYELLTESFSDFNKTNTSCFHDCLTRFKELLILNRFPLLEDRIKHLSELEYALPFCNDIETRYACGIGFLEFPELFENLLVNFPGFASDIFLKRASLFFIQLYRRFGWLKEELKMLHVPADYQIPKMLETLNCIVYHPYLSMNISNDKLIPKNSKEECEIRSATILAMRELCRLTDWNIADVDAYLFTRRHLSINKFHLTITTDY